MEAIDVLDIPVVKFCTSIRAEGMIIVDTPTKGLVPARAVFSRDLCSIDGKCMFAVVPRIGEVGAHCVLMADGNLKPCSSKFYHPSTDE